MRLIRDLLACLLSAWVWAVPAGAQAARIESVELLPAAEGVNLTITGAGSLQWTVRDQSSDQVILRFRDCLPGSGVTDLAPPDGLIASVETSVHGTAAVPETRVSVRARGAVKYRIETGPPRIVVHFEARDTAGAPPRPAPPRTAPPRTVPPPPSAVPPPAPPRAEPGEYRIGSEDVLRIEVFGLDEMNRTVRVSRDGRISLPLLGTLEVVGLTPREGSALIARALRAADLVREPQVSIFIEEYVSSSVSLQGAVEKPGSYQLIGTRTLLEVIGTAGGVKEGAGSDVHVLRGKAGDQRKIDIDLEALLDLGDLSLNIPLEPGDIVMIPYSRQLRVYVTGAVERPGPVPFQSSEGITVLQAITAAGGPNNRANLRNVHIIRKGAGGAQERIKVNLKKIRSGKAEDIVLEKNDTVVVGEWFL